MCVVERPRSKLTSIGGPVLILITTQWPIALGTFTKSIISRMASRKAKLPKFKGKGKHAMEIISTMTHEEWKQEVKDIVLREYGLTPEQCQDKGVDIEKVIKNYDYNYHCDDDDYAANDLAAEIMAMLFAVRHNQ